MRVRWRRASSRARGSQARAARGPARRVQQQMQRRPDRQILGAQQAFALFRRRAPSVSSRHSRAQPARLRGSAVSSGPSARQSRAPGNSRGSAAPPPRRLAQLGGRGRCRRPSCGRRWRRPAGRARSRGARILRVAAPGQEGEVRGDRRARRRPSARRTTPHDGPASGGIGVSWRARRSVREFLAGPGAEPSVGAMSVMPTPGVQS